jgi:gluconate 5-dehydrogenase
MQTQSQSFRLDGKLAIITGASKGIGLGIAKAMSNAGASILLLSRQTPELDNAVAQIRNEGGTADACPFDLHNYPQLNEWYSGVVSTHGIPDILVNAAGITRRGPADKLSLDDWHEVMSINLSAVFAMSQAFAQRLLAASKPGKIVNIASLMTSASRPGTSAYTASKGGIGQLTKALALDWAPKGIHVNAIAPGFIQTELTGPLWNDPTFFEWVTKRTPMARWGQPDDIALPAVFMASAASDFMTGQVVYVDGGFLATF